eukprot:gnl/Trimastix_PCT/4361.p1 GENE.gnl/Trimastix_PCT/4361~~gnl/Trimastix_PCT/4361.p1  ORF type:complete len:346 (-),score=50.04 gnl/Trimastix_PCT/4361:12-1049(-)
MSQHVRLGDSVTVSFNQDKTYFSVAHPSGFACFSCNPFGCAFRRDFPDCRGLDLAEMLQGSNVIFLAGRDGNTRFPPNQVVIWDDHTGVPRGIEIVNAARAIKVRSDYLVIVQESHTTIWQLFADGKLSPRQVRRIKTFPNAAGICAITTQGPLRVAVPDVSEGRVRIVSPALPAERDVVIPAQKSQLACIAMDAEGRRVATASHNGTVIQVYDVTSGALLVKLRRGSTAHARVTALAFNFNARCLVSVSHHDQHGTAHFFAVPEEAQRSRLSVPFIDGVRSSVTLALPCGPAHCAFTPDNSLVILTCEGRFLRVAFSLRDKSAAITEEHQFYDLAPPGGTPDKQ